MKSNKIKRKVVQITITEKCNLNCVYCYEHDKDCRSLDLQFVKDAMLNAFSDDRFEEVEFDFHGGEPACAFDILKPACEWLWSEERPKPYMCFATTNGTLIHGIIQEWFRKNSKRFWLGLSIDGTPEMHNANRSNSYDQIDIAFFKETWPDQTAKMTISPLSIRSLSDGIKHIHKLGFKFSANLAYGIKWEQELHGVYRDELKKIADFYLDHPEYEPVRLVNFGIKKIGLNQLFPEKKENSKWCGTGDAMMCYGVSGKTYPCQVFAPSSHSKEGDKLAQKIDFSNCENFIDPKCLKCPLDNTCPGCYAHNYLETGNLYTRPEYLCNFFKCEAVATSYLYGKMLMNAKRYPATKDLSDVEKAMYAKGIEIVQKEVADEVMNY